MAPNPVDKLIEISQQNQVLLSNMQVNQEIMIALEQDKQKKETYKFIWEIAKYGIWIIIIVISFSFTQKLVSGFSSSIGKNIGNQILPSSTSDIEALLNSL